MLYLLRHGETEWNRVGRRQGRGDSPLTALGRRQAAACGEVLKREITDISQALMLTSPLGRARATAEIVRVVLGLSEERVRVLDCLAEQDMGEWQGLSNRGVDERFPGARARRDKDKWNYVIPGGESAAMVHQRLLPWLRSCREDRTTVVVAHEVVSRMIRGIYLALDPAETLKLDHSHGRIYRLSQGEVTTIDAAVDLA
ncbi:MAG: histidine phosphatase family protein [Sulfurifustis sp.]